MNTKQYELLVKSIDPSEGRFSGRASVYNVIDHGNDVVVPGAFAKALARSNRVPVLDGHDVAKAIGMGTLRDARDGLWIDVKLILAIERARDAFELVKAGVVTGLSIGYTVERDRTRKDGVRELLDIDLGEVSLVTFPMCDPARVDPSTIKRDRRAFERIWRDVESERDDAAALRRLAATIREIREAIR